jgi:hypothetical protein
MYASVRIRALLSICVLTTVASCDRGEKSATGQVETPRHKGLTEVNDATALSAVDGQTVYVPVYSQIPAGNRGSPFLLSVTLTIRNTDRSSPVFVTSVRYHGEDGGLVRDYLTKPLRIAPLAAADYFVQERDATGGTAASFLVEWVSESSVSEPVIEAVMVGTAGNQGISFTAPGRVIARKAK